VQTSNLAGGGLCHDICAVKKPRIYLDSCCFNRPFDDLTQERVRLESEAVLSIINQCELGRWDIYKGDVLDEEMNRMTNVFKKLKVMRLYSSATLFIEINDTIINRAKYFQNEFKTGTFDSLHLASAEYAGASILLTTDMKFIRRMFASDMAIRVTNPVVWLTEVMFSD